MASLREVIPLLPEQATLDWIERELPVASWRTRGFLLDRLIYLAPVDPFRTAAIYRSATGIREENGTFTLDPECWSDNLMSHHAIEWSLEGKDGRRSLMREFPTAFMPVAFMLSDALHNSENRHRFQAARHGLLDEYTAWSFWSDRRSPTASHRCLRAIHKCAAQLADSDITLFFSDIAPLFRASASLTIQSIYLDVLLERFQISAFADELAQRLLDWRLYRFSALNYWIQVGVLSTWPRLLNEQRATVLRNIDKVIEDSDDESAPFRRSRLLAGLPASDLSPDQQIAASSELAKGVPLPKHPRERFRTGVVSPPWSETDYEDERAQGWPDKFDNEQLRTLSRSMRALSGANVTQEIIERELPAAMGAALQLLPMLEAETEILDEPNRSWILDALETVLEKHQERKIGSESLVPPSAIVQGCSEVALTILETREFGAVKEPERIDVWYPPQSLWFRALALADSALIWAPVRDNKSLQDRFEAILIKALETNDAGVQAAVTTGVRPWHWLRTDERATLQDRLIWKAVRSGSVLAFSLATTQQCRDQRRLTIYRDLLGRSDIDHPEVLAERLGEYCGLYSMVLFSDIGRSSVANLAREIIDIPDQFALLKTNEARINFFRSFAFQMKETAKERWENTDLAADFGQWNLKIWRLLLPIRQKRQESESIVLFAMHWLEREEDEKRDISKLQVWWRELLPFVQAVPKEGNRPDCFTLFFNLRDPKMHFVLRAQELLESVNSIVTRLQRDMKSIGINLDATDPSNEDHNSWREVLRNVAEALETARARGLFRTEVHLETSRKLLATMAAEPFNIDAARTGLYRLQNASA